MPKKTMKATSGRARSRGRTKGGRAANPGPILITSASLVAFALASTLVLSVLGPTWNAGSQASIPAPESTAGPVAVSPSAEETGERREAERGSASERTGVPDGEATSSGKGKSATLTSEPGPAAPQDRDMGGLVAAGEALSLKAASRTRSTGGTARPPAARPVSKGPRLVFVIDDVGYNLSQLEPFVKLPFPLTFAVLPGLPHSAEAARMIKAAGKELILHQPMESVGGANPGPNAIYLSTTPVEAAAIVRRNLDSLPGAAGMNNHEGSAVTKDEALMAAILAVAKNRGIYYLDSLTIADTATEGVALREKIRYWERDVFLDNSPDRVSIVQYVEVGKKKAEKNGAAVMIGHVWSAELAQTLSDLYPSLVEGGFSLSTISKVMLEEADASIGD